MVNLNKIVRVADFNKAPPSQLSTWKMVESTDPIYFIDWKGKNMIQQNLKYNVQDVLKVLRENRKDHVRIFEEAVVGYGKAVKQLLHDLTTDLVAVEDNKVIDVDLRSRINDVLDKPRCHETDYDVVIKMLDMTSQKELELTPHEVAQYILDRWNWTDQFVQCGIAYSQTAVQKYRKK